MPTVRLTTTMHETVREVAADDHQSMLTALAYATESYRRERMFERADAIYAAMTPEEWAEEEAERALWDCTLMDGLEEDEEA